MKAKVLCLILAFAPMCASADAAKPPVKAAALTISVERGPRPHLFPETDGENQRRLHPRWIVSLDAAGRVVALAPVDAPLVPAISAPLENAIRAWHFQPGAIGGRPTETKTTLALDITLVERGADQFALRVDGARTGADLPVKGMHGVYPKFPNDALRHKQQGMVVLRVAFDDRGHVVDARLADGAPEIYPSLLRSAATSARRWTLTPEVVGGRGIAGSALVPICFEDYREHDPTTAHTCEWNPPAGHESLGDGAIVAIDPAARLETDVVGHAL